MERRGCRRVGRVQVFLDGLLEGNSWGGTAGGGRVYGGVAGGETCERETDGGEGGCRGDCAELDFCICAAGWKTCAEREEFFALLGKIVLEMDDGEGLLICGDLSRRVGAGVGCFEGVRGGFGFGERGVEGGMMLEIADAWSFVVADTWFGRSDGGLVACGIPGGAGLWLVTF